MTLDDLARALIVLALGDIGVTVLLVRAAKAQPEAALQERAIASVILTFIAGIVAFMAAAYLLDLTLPGPLGTGMLAGALLLVSLPQMVWAVMYWHGTFR